MDRYFRKKSRIELPISRREDFIMEYKDFETDAIEQIYVSTKGDMRKFKEICTDCRDRANELNCSFVDVNLALEFFSDLPPH